MSLTLEQYVERLDSRSDLPWPIAPKIDPVKAKPSLHALPVKAVFWTVYGTLVAIPGGELQFEHPQDFVTDAALEKLIKEFKMWNSMSRKPGAPSAYMKELFRKALTTMQMAGSGGEKFPEIQAERVWDDIVKKLLQKDYSYDASTYGSMGDYVKKIAYFYHASIQGSGAYPGAADALKLLADRSITQGLLGDGQCFTVGQLQRCLKQQDPGFELAAVMPETMRLISSDKKAKKPSETLFKAAVQAASARGISPSEVLHVGSSLTRDIAPAKKVGFRTALFAGDRNSLVATPEQLKDPATRPDVLLTELPQILDAIA
ncbi:MAG: HAD hydrolase-like protein [Planctomycetes bacterium]|nr:HAD hydrolase-like protein [Planctomycetota bacterium]